MAHRSGTKRRGIPHGFWLLQRALEPLVFGTPHKSVRASEPFAAGTISEGGRQCRFDVVLSQWRWTFRRQLGSSLELSGSGSVRPRWQSLHEKWKGDASQ